MSAGFQKANAPQCRLQNIILLLSRLGVLSGCALLTACSSPSAPEKTPGESRQQAAPDAPATTATTPGKAELQTFYTGTMDGKLAVRLCLLPVDTAVYGDYYYGQHRAGLALLGLRLPTGQLRLREFASRAHPDRPTAEFLLVRAPDGSLVGTWRMLLPARSRQLAVALRPYTPLPVADCRVRIAGAESSKPTITVPDAAVTQFLRLQLRVLVAEDGGDPGTQQLSVEYAGHCLLSVRMYSEMDGANVTPGITHMLYDLRTGDGIPVENEIDPRKVPALVAEASRRVQSQTQRFINDNKLEEEDVAGLHEQRYTRATFDASTGSYLLDDSVRFPFPVQYGAMSSFMSKSYTDAFAASFSFAEIQPYLLPKSPLRRLAPAAPGGN